jgi:serine/threonine protein kinase
MPVGDPSPPTDDPLIGKVLSERYRIVRKIGEGGMGAVYQAEHALIEKKIALKILFQDLTRRPDLIARFLQEAKSASRIGHENVIDISDFGQSPGGMVFIAMEYLDGQDLGKTLKKTGAMEWERARPILMQIAKGAPRRARQRHHPPRHEAGERLPRSARGARRLREGARLRHRQDRQPRRVRRVRR